MISILHFFINPFFPSFFQADSKSGCRASSSWHFCFKNLKRWLIHVENRVILIVRPSHNAALTFYFQAFPFFYIDNCVSIYSIFPIPQCIEKIAQVFSLSNTLTPTYKFIYFLIFFISNSLKLLQKVWNCNMGRR